MTTSELALIVCGARNWTDREFVYAKLDVFHAEHPEFTLIEGEAAGVDRTAGTWAKRTAGVEHLPMPADWKSHEPAYCPGNWCVSTKDYCLAAGAARNQAMVDMALRFDDQFVLAFKDGFDHSGRRGGTEDLVKRARTAGITGLLIHH